MTTHFIVSVSLVLSLSLTQPTDLSVLLCVWATVMFSDESVIAFLPNREDITDLLASILWLSHNLYNNKN